MARGRVAELHAVVSRTARRRWPYYIKNNCIKLQQKEQHCIVERTSIQTEDFTIHTNCMIYQKDPWECRTHTHAELHAEFFRSLGVTRLLFFNEVCAACK